MRNPDLRSNAEREHDKFRAQCRLRDLEHERNTMTEAQADERMVAVILRAAEERGGVVTEQDFLRANIPMRFIRSRARACYAKAKAMAAHVTTAFAEDPREKKIVRVK